MKKTILILLLLTAVVIVGCSKSNSLNGNAVSTVTTGNTASTFTGDLVKIPLSEVSETVKKYNYDAQGTKVTYFAVKGSDGKVRTAFDACDVCGGSLGYTQNGGDIECKNCGRVFKIDGLGSKNKGYGCWPSYLPHEIKGDQVIIKTTDLDVGKHHFV